MISGHAQWEALGTTVVVRVTDPHATALARTEVERELDDVDRACSRFRDDSELARLNARSGRTHGVSPVLAEALALSTGYVALVASARRASTCIGGARKT